ncbi:lipase secretion chaperone [Vibrio pacinii]|uniref:lipase secretion chaperone n=1 Tax=Vibrio pacinii TaxID=170674 RepID=UPI00057190CB|nr:lipase secretion chaperone [Vibrio pacinii]
MKKIALVSLVIALSVYFSAIAFFTEEPLVSAPITLAPSQYDIEPDTSSEKSFYDYALSSLGERNIEQIQQHVSQQANNNDMVSITPELFTLYLDYKSALMQLDPLPSDSINALALEQLDIGILTLQRQFFTPQQIALLFTDENHLRQLAIEKAWAAESSLSNEQQQQLLEDKLLTMPDYIQRAESNTQLLTQLNRLPEHNNQQRYTTSIELVGQQGAERLAALDKQRATFQTELTHYLAIRQQLLTSASITDPSLQVQLNELRQQHFATKQLKRVEALERLYDQGLLEAP